MLPKRYILLLWIMIHISLSGQSYWYFKERNKPYTSLKDSSFINKTKSLRSTACPCPENVDFENGDFSNWNCYRGIAAEVNNSNVVLECDANGNILFPNKEGWTSCSTSTTSTTWPYQKKFQITSAASGNDKYGAFPCLCPYPHSGNYSMKLGNDDVSAEAERINYTFTVPCDKFVIVYYYAVVLEDPNHKLYQQPRFKAKIYDADDPSNIIACANFDYTASSGLPGFKTSLVSKDPGKPVYYKSWTPVTVNLTGYKGKKIVLEFITEDCTQLAHFGYAYVDVSSECSTLISGAAYCSDTSSLVLTAPYGYETYNWWNDDFTKILGTGQTLTVSPPPTSNMAIHIDMTPYSGYGCKDTAYTVIAVNKPTVSTTIASICNGETYTFNAKPYTKADTDTIHLTNAAGCDSAAILILKIKQPTFSTTKVSICQNDSCIFNGKPYKAAGIYTVHLLNAEGCDSSAVLDLKVNQPTSSTTKISICQNDSCMFNSKTYKATGIYTVHLPNAVGCDSSAILNLKVIPSTFSTTKVSICQNDSCIFNGKPYKVAGTYTVHKINAAGCDSSAVLDLKVNPPTFSTTKISICQNDSCTFNGQTYKAAGTYTAHKINATGCDSSAILNLKVNPPTTGILYTSICENSGYTMGGNTYTVAGIYYPHITNVAGCDSAVTLHLSIIPKKETSVAEEICSNEAYILGKRKLTQAGTYTENFHSSQGCDSIVTLYLTVKPTYINYRTIKLVYGETDTVDGEIYNKAGTFTKLFSAANGCDSTVVTTVINVKTLCPKIIVPPYFTPNRDGINDFWEIENLSCYKKSTVDIYDRFSKHLIHYNGTDLGWDGNYLGHPEPSTDYWYIITLPETAERITGHVTLKR